jgi:hypothetical protein
MIIGGVTEIVFGVDAERRGLDSIAKPLSAVGSAVRGGAARAGAGARRARPRTAPEPQQGLGS